MNVNVTVWYCVRFLTVDGWSKAAVLTREAAQAGPREAAQAGPREAAQATATSAVLDIQLIRDYHIVTR